MPVASKKVVKKPKTIDFYIREFFMKHPNKDIQQQEVVAYVWKFRKSMDTWRSVRGLYEKGWLKFVSKGVYRYEPGYKGPNLRNPFPAPVKAAIFKRDDYRCVICKNGRHNGYEIHADHIIPQARGGASTVENGQTLCSECNMLKKNRSDPEFLKRLASRAIKAAKESKDEKAEKMFTEIVEVLTRNGIK